jgi:hypothetical protein
MIGLSEAVYYALRVYDHEARVIVDELAAMPNPPRSVAATMKAMQKSHDKLTEGFVEMTGIISSSPSSDPIMRNLNKWYKLVDEAHIKSTILVNEYKKSFASTIPKSKIACPTPRGPGIDTLVSMKPELAKYV